MAAAPSAPASILPLSPNADSPTPPPGKRRAQLRARGHGHALRSVADRLLNVACAMLRDRACFDAHRVGSAAT